MKKTLAAVLVILVLFLGISALVVTYPDEYMLVKQFGEIVRVEEKPGVSFKVPVIQEAESLPKCMQIYDIPKSDVITRDKKTMIADAFVLWRINDPVKFTRYLNGQLAQAQSRISASVFSSLKSVISNMDQSAIIENRNGKLAQDIRNSIGDSLEGYGIEILSVETKSLDMPDDNKQAVYERMISERQNIAASYTAQGEAEAQKIRNETDKEVTVMEADAKKQAEILTAEGEAEYMKILSKAYDTEDKADFYNFMRSLDALKGSLSGKEKTISLDKDSDLVKVLYGNENNAGK